MSIPTLIGFISEWLGVLAVAALAALNPRFQHQPIGFRYARRDGLIALSLYIVILAFSFVFYQQFQPPVFTDPLRMSPAPVHALSQALLLAFLCLLPFLIALVLRKQPPKSTGWRHSLLFSRLQLGIAIALLTIFLRNRVMVVLGGASEPIWNALPLALGVAVLEETIFRGYIQLRLAWWMKTWPGIVVTAALFAIWHLAPWMGRLPTETILILSGLTFAQGLVLGWIMHKTGHVAAPALYRAVSIWMNWIG